MYPCPWLLAGNGLCQLAFHFIPQIQPTKHPSLEHCLKNCQFSAIVTSVDWFCAPLHTKLCTHTYGCWLALAFVNWVFTTYQKNNPPSIQLWSIVWRTVNFLQFWPALADSVRQCMHVCVPTPMAVGWFWPLSIGFSLHTKKITHQASNFRALFEESSIFHNFYQRRLIHCTTARKVVHPGPELMVGFDTLVMEFHMWFQPSWYVKCVRSNGASKCKQTGTSV